MLGSAQKAFQSNRSALADTLALPILAKDGNTKTRKYFNGTHLRRNRADYQACAMTCSAPEVALYTLKF